MLNVGGQVQGKGETLPQMTSLELSCSRLLVDALTSNPLTS
jgi:hypothetical protein